MFALDLLVCEEEESEEELDNIREPPSTLIPVGEEEVEVEHGSSEGTSNSWVEGRVALRFQSFRLVEEEGKSNISLSPQQMCARINMSTEHQEKGEKRKQGRKTAVSGRRVALQDLIALGLGERTGRGGQAEPLHSWYLCFAASRKGQNGEQVDGRRDQKEERAEA